MTFKMTERAQRATIKRRYRCDDCAHEFSEIISPDDEETLPDCPMCVATFGVASPKTPVVWVPPLVGRRTSISHAVEMTYKMAERDFGFTNMADHQRPGDIAALPPSPMQTAEREKMTRDLVQAGVPEETSTQITDAAKNFWQGGTAGAAGTMGNIENARLASAEGVAQGVDPIGMLEKARETGTMRPKYDVVAAGKLSEA